MEKALYPKYCDRPGSQPTQARLNEDLGTSFGALRKRVKPDSKGMVNLDRDDDDDDDDELDMLSTTSQPEAREKLETEVVIKRMKFNKIKKPDTNADATAPTSKENTQREAAKKAALERDSSKNAVASSSATRPLRDNVATRNQSAEGRIRGAELQTRKPTVETKSERPEPRPIAPTRPRVPLVPPTSQRKPPPKLSATSSVSSLDGSPSVSGKKQEKQTRPTASPFPTVSPLAKGKGKETDRLQKRKEPLPTDLEGRKGNGKGKEKERPSKLKQAFPEAGLSPLSSPSKPPGCFLPSPLGTPNKKSKLASTEFPAPSPLRPEGKPKSKLKALPFPMNTQTFEGSPSSSPGKRRSLGSDSDDERDRKRYKNQPVVLAQSYDYEEDSELLFISPGTDPKTLCPYCDTPLPAQPTPLLTRLLEQTFNKSYRDVRPSNPLGRKAPMGVFVAVCQRHRFESETLPEAEARGWPKYINWAGLKLRVVAMKEELQQVLEDPGDPIIYGNDDGEERQKDASRSERKKGPRMRCIFWNDLAKELRTKGSKGVKGVQGQFANFEKTQPGYYGELGSVIIHQTLYDMFPLTTIDPYLVDPLTPNEFIQRILVPEVGMRLVMEDMDLDPDVKSDKKQAVAILRESASYGVAMFPEDGGDWAGASGKKHKGGDEEAMGVADQMVMERARKRRKELEIEEREEDEMWRLQEEEEEAEKQKAEAAKEKRRARRKAKVKEAEPVEVDPTAVTRPRPKPIPKKKGKSVVTVDSASEMDTDSSSDPRLSRNDSDVDIKSDGERELVPTPKPRSRHVDKLDIAKMSDSDSEFPLGVLAAPSTQRTKRKAKSARATPASSEAEFEVGTSRVNASPRPRSPSASLTSSRQSTRGSSVLDLCSSSEDNGSVIDGSNRKARPRRSPLSRRKQPLKPFEIPSSSDEENMEATPRAKAPKTGSHQTSAASSNFLPLEAARRRAPVVRGERSTSQRDPQWITSMAKDVVDISDDDEKPDRARSEESDSWLLDDISQS